MNGPAMVEFGPAASVLFSHANGIFPVERFQVWERARVRVRTRSVTGSEQQTFLDSRRDFSLLGVGCKNRWRGFET